MTDIFDEYPFLRLSQPEYRRIGKTFRRLTWALQQASKGKSVLYLTPSLHQRRYAIDTACRHLAAAGVAFARNRTTLKIAEDGGRIVFLSLNDIECQSKLLGYNAEDMVTDVPPPYDQMPTVKKNYDWCLQWFVGTRPHPSPFKLTPWQKVKRGVKRLTPWRAK